MGNTIVPVLVGQSPGTPGSTPGGIVAYDATDGTWKPDPQAQHYVRYPGDPDPTPEMGTNDVLITVT